MVFLSFRNSEGTLRHQWCACAVPSLSTLPPTRRRRLLSPPSCIPEPDRNTSLPSNMSFTVEERGNLNSLSYRLFFSEYKPSRNSTVSFSFATLRGLREPRRPAATSHVSLIHLLLHHISDRVDVFSHAGNYKQISASLDCRTGSSRAVQSCADRFYRNADRKWDDLVCHITRILPALSPTLHLVLAWTLQKEVADLYS